LAVSILLLAIFLKIVPSTESVKLQNRAQIAEATASAISLFLASSSYDEISSHLGFLVDRNADVYGAQIYRSRDESTVSFGEEGRITQAIADSASGEKDASTDQENIYSTPEVLRVPLSQGESQWGSVTLFFEKLSGSGLIEQARSSKFAPAVFLGICCFGLFYWYLGRMLKQLNPSSAVPGRVRSALDTSILYIGWRRVRGFDRTLK